MNERPDLSDDVLDRAKWFIGLSGEQLEPPAALAAASLLDEEQGEVPPALWTPEQLVHASGLVERVEDRVVLRQGDDGIELHDLDEERVGHVLSLFHLEALGPFKARVGQWTLVVDHPGETEGGLEGQLLSRGRTRTIHRKDGGVSFVSKLTFDTAAGEVEVHAWDDVLRRVVEQSEGVTMRLTDVYEREYRGSTELHTGRGCDVRVLDATHGQRS